MHLKQISVLILQLSFLYELHKNHPFILEKIIQVNQDIYLKRMVNEKPIVKHSQKNPYNT